MRGKALFITRSDIGWYSKNANVYRKSLEVATKYDATLYASRECRVPDEIVGRYSRIARFGKVLDVLSCVQDLEAGTQVFTGFDFPCMYVAWRLKRRMPVDGLPVGPAELESPRWIPAAPLGD